MMLDWHNGRLKEVVLNLGPDTTSWLRDLVSLLTLSESLFPLPRKEDYNIPRLVLGLK